ncbi:uncharacterized protein LOC112057056 [Bicyclus anynana]|uniref:Uncharacterized protein LOC112057056 n=1 Tax=Bicyclus anynana TaxID=110368 RepID=A0ABM3LSZ5_BICAN|nr:uncharacterized protein LOC112057056 [Bicyclus anynana]
MVNKCGICGKFINPLDGIKCTKCDGLYHQVCLKLSPGHQVSSKWRCRSCKGNKLDNKGSSSSRMHSCADGHTDDIREDLSPLLQVSSGNMVEEVRQVIRAEMSSFRDELARICSTISDFNNRANAIESRLSTLEDQLAARAMDEEVRMSTIEERLAVRGVREENVNLNGIISQLQTQLNDREQECFLCDVEISGLEERSGENLINMVSLIGKKLGVDLDDRDVVSVERSGPRPSAVEGGSQQRSRVVTVRLTRRALRDELLRAARVRRGADTSGINSGTPRRFYINERLTRLNKQLFYKAREEGRRKGWRYVWTSGGRIYIRRGAGTPAYRIRSDMDIEKFFGDAIV